MHEKEVREELVGLLSAISIVSKRLARNLMKLDQQTPAKEGSDANAGSKEPVSPDAD